MNINEKIKIAIDLLYERLGKIRSRLPIEEQYEWCPDYTEEEEEQMNFIEELIDILEAE